METFYDKPKAFEQWIQREKKKDMGLFYKTYIMPFLPKPEKEGKVAQERVATKIVFDFHDAKKPTTFDATTGREFDES